MHITNLFAPLILLTGLANAQFACIAIVTATINYEQAYSALTAGPACPTGFYQLSDASTACCASTQQYRTFGGGNVGCCRCGAFCTGSPPSLLAFGAGSSATSTSLSASTSNPIFIPSGVTLTTPSATRTGTGISITTSTLVSTSSTTRPSSSASAPSSATPPATQTGSGADASAVLPGTFLSGALFVLALVRSVFGV